MLRRYVQMVHTETKSHYQHASKLRRYVQMVHTETQTHTNTTQPRCVAMSKWFTLKQRQSLSARQQAAALYPNGSHWNKISHYQHASLLRSYVQMVHTETKKVTISTPASCGAMSNWFTLKQRQSQSARQQAAALCPNGSHWNKDSHYNNTTALPWHHRTPRRVVSTPASYLGGPRSKSRSKDGLFWVRLLMTSLTSSSKCRVDVFRQSMAILLQILSSLLFIHDIITRCHVVCAADTVVEEATKKGLHKNNVITLI
jgi:hypothetical protein